MPCLARLAAALLTIALGVTLSACDSSSSPAVATAGQQRFRVVAGENFSGKHRLPARGRQGERAQHHRQP